VRVWGLLKTEMPTFVTSWPGPDRLAVLNDKGSVNFKVRSAGPTAWGLPPAWPDPGRFHCKSSAFRRGPVSILVVSTAFSTPMII